MLSAEGRFLPAVEILFCLFIVLFCLFIVLFCLVIVLFCLFIGLVIVEKRWRAVAPGMQQTLHARDKERGKMVAITRSASQVRLRGGRVIKGFRLGPLNGPLARGAPRARQPRACQLRARQLRRVQEHHEVNAGEPDLAARQRGPELPLVAQRDAVQEQAVSAGEPDPEPVDPETTIQPAHSIFHIFRVAAARLQAQAVASAAARAARRAPQQQQEEAWGWEEPLVRTMNDELGLPY